MVNYEVEEKRWSVAREPCVFLTRQHAHGLAAVGFGEDEAKYNLKIHARSEDAGNDVERMRTKVADR